MKYKNFDLAIYCPAPDLERYDNMDDLAKDIDFFQKHLKVDRVYLETHRNKVDVSREKMLAVIELFQEKGIAVSGGITPTIRGEMNDRISDRFLNVFCYTDEEMRQEIKEISEYTASLFDEFILDDFFFTNCACPSCIEAKGSQTWPEFRLNLMKDVSENLIVGPAKKVNPDVKVIIKYPNWIESFQQSGYNTAAQPAIFDYIYTGTETRDSRYTHQHLPRYASYSLMRWMENLKPEHNGGGWFDWIDCIHNIGYYLEQAYLTAFSKAKELMLFSFGGLKNTVFVPALGHELGKLDNYLAMLGNPTGIKVYEPNHADGEDHLYDYLGMIGLAFEPTPKFPETDSTILVTENSSIDDNIIKKMKAHMLKGGNIVMTSGFLNKMTDKGAEEFTSVSYSDRKVYTNSYAFETMGCAFANYTKGHKEIIFPALIFKNNTTWPLIVAMDEENSFPLLTKDNYGNGCIYTLIVPDNFADLYHLPNPVLNKIRQEVMGDMDVYLEGDSNVGLFLYDNNTFIIESFLPHRSSIKIHIKGSNIELTELKSSKQVKGQKISENEWVFEFNMEPTNYYLFKY
ncbi:MAG: permease [Halanaerobiales bacterium]